MESSQQVLSARSVSASHTWIIEGFSMLDATMGKAVKSKEFSLLGSKWELHLYTGGVIEEYKNWVSVYLHHNGGEAVQARFSFSLLAADGRVLHDHASKSVHRFGVAKPSKGWKQLLRRSDILDSTKGFLVDDTLRIKCTIHKREELHFSAQPSSVPMQLQAEKGVCATLAKLLESGKHSARSQFFEAMFSHKMSESLEGVVRFDDIALPVFRQLLRFIYTGVCDFSGAGSTDTKDEKDKDKDKKKYGKEEKKHLHSLSQSQTHSQPHAQAQTQAHAQTHSSIALPTQLMAAADRFQISELHTLCAARLSEIVSTENAAELLMLAETCHAPDLKRHVLAFVRADSKRLTEVMDTDEFQKLSPALLHEMLAQFGSSANAKKRARGHDTDSDQTLRKDGVKKLKVSELRAELESRGLETSGMKTELVERLENALGSNSTSSASNGNSSSDSGAEGIAVDSDLDDL